MKNLLLQRRFEMISLRELTEIKDLEILGEIEKNIWNTHQLPIHQTLTAVKNGGIIIGAFDNDKIIGFSYAFAGFKNGQIYLCSHMLGIDEGYRSKGIGGSLKNKQQEIAIQKGYREIRWTYDPLETRNAYLNLTKLKGICSVYKENAYGEMKDDLNKGLPSDRFEVHWHISSEHVTAVKAENYNNAVSLNKVNIRNGIPACAVLYNEKLTAEVYSFTVPKDFQHVKAYNPELAVEWRLITRNIFQKLFSAGYTAVHLIPGKHTAQYIFVKHNTLQLGGHNE